jgi:CDP-glucose 4,6-dehydratase
MGTVNLFEAVRQLGSGCVVVNVTSDKCYAPHASGVAHREEDPMGGDDPYSNSKGCAELVTTSFRQSFFSRTPLDRQILLASARAGNAIGGGDWTADQLIPDLVRGFMSGQPCLIRSPGGIRPWQFVLEPLRGYLKLAERLAQDGQRHASGWNFGPSDDDAKPVSWIADRLSEQWGGGAKWSLDPHAHAPELATLRLDASKAEALGWRPALPLAAALDWIVEWYRGWAEHADARALTLNQIAQYEQLFAGDFAGARD